LRYLALCLLFLALTAIAQPDLDPPIPGVRPAEPAIRIETDVTVMLGDTPLVPLHLLADWWHVTPALDLRAGTCTLNGKVVPAIQVPALKGVVLARADALAKAIDGTCVRTRDGFVLISARRRRAILRDGLALLLSEDDARSIVWLLGQHRLTELDLFLAAVPAAAKARMDGATMVGKAVESGEPGGIALLWAHGADVNAPTEDGEAPLTQAVKAKHLACAEMLLKCGAYVDVRGGDPQVSAPPLHAAVEQGDLPMVELLLAHGADVLARMWSNEEMPPDLAEAVNDPAFATPIMFASNAAIAALLVAHGAPTPGPHLAEAIVKGRAKMKMTMCTNNLRQLALAIVMYAGDHDGVYPTVEGCWAMLMVGPECLRCPMAPDVPNGYGYNTHIAGKGEGDIRDRATVLAFADCKAPGGLIRTLEDIDQTRHDGGFVAVFLDGHAEYLKAGTKVRLE
jgi:prepilin-type processing-associated H-X9-DG protein